MAVQNLDSCQSIECLKHIIKALNAGLCKMDKLKRRETCTMDALPAVWRYIDIFWSQQQSCYFALDLRFQILSDIVSCFLPLVRKSKSCQALLVGMLLLFLEKQLARNHQSSTAETLSVPQQNMNSDVTYVLQKIVALLLSPSDQTGMGLEVELNELLNTHYRYEFRETREVSQEQKQKENPPNYDTCVDLSIEGPLPWSRHGIALLVHFLLFNKINKESLVIFPQILSQQEYFRLLFPNVSPLLKDGAVENCFKGIEILEWLMKVTPISSNLNGGYLSWKMKERNDVEGQKNAPEKRHFTDSSIIDVFDHCLLLQQLVGFLAVCPDTQMRTRARKVTDFFIDLFRLNDRFFLLSHIVQDCPYSTVKSLFLDRVKKEVMHSTKLKRAQEECEHVLISEQEKPQKLLFLQKPVIKTFVTPFVEEILKSDIVELLTNLDCFTSALALYRLLLLVDVENSSGIWDESKCAALSESFQLFLKILKQNFSEWENRPCGKKEMETVSQARMEQEVSTIEDFHRLGILQEAISCILELFTSRKILSNS